MKKILLAGLCLLSGASCVPYYALVGFTYGTATVRRMDPKWVKDFDKSPAENTSCPDLSGIYERQWGGDYLTDNFSAFMIDTMLPSFRNLPFDMPEEQQKILWKNLQQDARTKKDKKGVDVSKVVFEKKQADDSRHYKMNIFYKNGMLMGDLPSN